MSNNNNENFFTESAERLTKAVAELQAMHPLSEMSDVQPIPADFFAQIRETVDKFFGQES
jgi:hypothetical protein